MRQPWKKRVGNFARHQLAPVAFLVMTLCAFRSSIADWNDVPTGSMRPSILEGDRIFVNKLAYDLKVPFTTWHLAEWGEPRRGDVVVCYSPVDGTRLVKRVVGVPGDRLAMSGNRVFVNGAQAAYGPIDPGVLADVPAAQRPGHQFATETLVPGGAGHPVASTPGRPARRSFAPLTVPDGQYFLMGDNRDNSHDSRYYGFVDRDQIVGRAVGVAISVDPEKWYWPRWGRSFTSLP